MLGIQSVVLTALLLSVSGNRTTKLEPSSSGDDETMMGCPPPLPYDSVLIT